MKKSISMNLAAFFIAVGFVCMLAFWAIGSEIDADGTLHEPFALIPLGWLSLAIGVCIGLFRLIQNVRGARHQS